MIPLKPCPFCGSKDVFCASDHYEQYYVACQSCGALFESDPVSKDSMERTIDHWNTRKGEPKRCCMNCKHVEYIDRGWGEDIGAVGCSHPDGGTPDEFDKNGIEVCDKWEAKE